jgi:hypothetical protein
MPAVGSTGRLGRVINDLPEVLQVSADERPGDTGDIGYRRCIARRKY